MRVCVRLFAGLRDAVGERTIDFELSDGATVDELKQRLGEDYPATRPMLATSVCAIDDEYVSFDERLREGAEVALIPPVSGGASCLAREKSPSVICIPLGIPTPSHSQSPFVMSLSNHATLVERRVLRQAQDDPFREGAQHD